jgi:ERF superfamily
MNDQAVAVGTAMKLPSLAQMENAAFVSLIERLSADPTIDLDRLQQAMNMRDRVVERNARLAFNAAMSAVQAEIDPIARRAENEQTHSKYAKLEHVNAAIVPIYTKHGFSVIFGEATSAREDHRRVLLTLSHDDGHTINGWLDVALDGVGMKGVANKTATHAGMSSISYGRRYLLLMTFNISTFDDNDGNLRQIDEARRLNAPSGLTAEQRDTLHDGLTKYVKDRAGFLKAFHATSVSDFPPDQYDHAIDVLKGRAAKARAEAEKDASK